VSKEYEPKWISKAQVLRIHEKTIELQGGLSGSSEEGQGKLEGCLARPHNLYLYEKPDLFDLAASYAQSIARSHAFNDGNKRTAYQTADLFLYKNGYDLGIKDEKEQISFFEAFAAGQVSREEMAEFYRQNTIKIKAKI